MNILFISAFLILSFLYQATAESTNSTSGCGAKTSCGDCTGDLNCVWCHNDGYCKKGDYWGASCGGWRWAQCEADGKTLMIVELCAAATIVLICLCCVIRCFCCKRKRRYESAAEYTQLETDPGETRSAHPKTDEQRKRIYEKYGLA